MKNIFVLLIFLFTVTLNAQEIAYSKPDFALIEKTYKDKKSTLNYEALYKRYVAADTTMTMQERQHLYFGYSFTDKYSPYGRSKSEEKLRSILEKPTLTEKDKRNGIKLCDEVLSNFPFSINVKAYKQYFLDGLGMKAEAEKENIQSVIIIDAIMSTGDGTSVKTPMYVINVTNEYEILRILNFEPAGQELLDGPIDQMKVVKNDTGIEALYFDVSRPFSSMKF